MRIAVLSDGAWGTALALNLVANGHEVTQWGPFPDYLAEMARTRENARFLPGVKLPQELHFEPEMGKAVSGRELLLLATPTQYLRSVLKQLQPFLEPERQLLVNVAKGIEVESWLRISEMVAEVLGRTRYAVLSGPSHAEEVSRRVPTAVVAASENSADAELVQRIFLNDNFRVYTSADVVGVELGGALKNVMAIAAGIIDGMKLGDNPKAAMMTRGISEMGRLGELLGGKAQTFSGLSGIGDLIVTCTSGHSRNRHVGEELGRGRKLPEILQSMGMVVAEGVPTARGAYTLARKTGAETPIIDEIYAVLYEGRDVPTAIRNLMSRTAKPE
ncbi:NAD(P)H-dependent glycerol-3-phosphate dehydrogenase [uncultured Victivallis sp.]|uniref:NAD(P)H-dependent glycerol-3-phosphate dehydrogenase n=1 Tax=Victivallis sp. TaxID=2049020 RepID=UPI0025D9ADE2|nr:NAD(P)H-dependent glycerol-3-phosphate dehydrogenase [uncultured Victivallis sp.]